MRAGVRGPPIFGPINLLYFCMTYFFDLNVLSHVWDISREYYSLSPTDDGVPPIRWNILDGVIYRWTCWRGTVFKLSFYMSLLNIFLIFMIYSLFNSLEVSVASKVSSTMMYDLGPIQTSRHSTPTQRKVKTLKERRVKEKKYVLKSGHYICLPALL